MSSRFEGTVFRLNADGTAEAFASDLGVACGLAFAPDGTLYVGDRTGTIFTVDRSGQATPFATLPPSVAAFHLALGPDGALYVSAPTLSTLRSGISHRFGGYGWDSKRSIRPASRVGVRCQGQPVRDRSAGGRKRAPSCASRWATGARARRPRPRRGRVPTRWRARGLLERHRIPPARVNAPAPPTKIDKRSARGRFRHVAEPGHGFAGPGSPGDRGGHRRRHLLLDRVQPPPGKCSLRGPSSGMARVLRWSCRSCSSGSSADWLRSATPSWPR